jgi:hypothetical protein
VAWCKASSLTAAVSRTLRDLRYPASRSRILAETHGKTLEGWDLSFFLEKALAKRTYGDLRGVMEDLENWLEKQG